MVQLFPLDNQLLTLAEEVKPGATKFRTLGRFAKTSIAEDDDSRYLVGKQYIGMSPFQDNAEVAYIDVTTQPDLVAGTTNTYEYTFVARGIHSDNTATPPTLTNVSEEKTHVGQRSSVGIVIGAGFFTSLSEAFVAASVEDTATAGEVIGIRQVVAIDSTDGLLYLFDSGNADHKLVGISNDDYLISTTASYTLSGGRSTGFTGLTAGATQYADTTTAGDITETATPYPLGATSADGTYINVSIPLGSVTIASQAEAEAGTDNVTVMTPLRTKQAIDATPKGFFSNQIITEDVEAGDAIARVDLSFATAASSVNSTYFGHTSAGEKIAFPIIGSGTSVASITISLAKVGAVADNVRMRIEGDNDGEPDGITSVGSQVDITGSGLTTFTTYTDQVFTFSAPITLTEGQIYWVTLQRTGSLSGSVYYVLGGININANTGANRLSIAHNYISGTWDRYYNSPNTYQPKVTFTGAMSGSVNMKSRLYFNEYLTFLGFSQETKAAGVDCLVSVQGVDSNQTGLTPYTNYYYGATPGSVGISSGKPSGTNTGIPLAISLSDTELRIKKENPTSNFIY